MSKTIQEWKSYYTEAPATPAELIIETLPNKVCRQACRDVKEICGIAEKLQAEIVKKNKALRICRENFGKISKQYKSGQHCICNDSADIIEEALKAK